jgi:KaiC/GvpD/RAD55 family RecA-like ATPase
MVLEKWIKSVGGVKQAIMWCADFSNFLFWDTLGHYCIRHYIDDVLKLEAYLIRHDIYDVLKIEQKINDFHLWLDNTGVRLFPAASEFLNCKTTEELKKAWDEFLEARRDKVKLYSEIASQRPVAFLYGRQSDIANVLEGLQDAISRTPDFKPLKIAELVDIERFLPKFLIDSRNSILCSEDEARYFALQAIRFRCKEGLCSKVASSIQSQTDILTRHIEKRRSVSENEYLRLRQDYFRLESSLWIKSHDLVHLLQEHIENPFASHFDEQKDNYQRSGLLLSYLAVLGALRPARASTEQSLRDQEKTIPSVSPKGFSDDQVLEFAKKHAKFGRRFEFLWGGSGEAHWKEHYISKNKADLSVVQSLADSIADCRKVDFTGAKSEVDLSGVALQIDRLFRKSRLMSDQWDELYFGGRTYGQTLIEGVLSKKQKEKPTQRNRQRDRSPKADRKRWGSFLLLGDRVNSEYCLSMIFGFPVGTTGISTLFGGGGIFLYDEPRYRNNESESLPGRIVLIRGGFGSGKTSLSLSLAAANAQTGGLSIYFALESGFEQLSFCLQRLGFRTDDSRFKLYRNFEDAYNYLRSRELSFDEKMRTGCTQEVDRTVGAFVIVPVAKEETDPIPGKKLLEKVEKVSQLRLPGFTRMILVDPLNALERNLNSSTEDEAAKQNSMYSTKRRREVLKSLQFSADLGSNLVLLSEEDDLTWTSFGEDIADTVIKLGGPIETVREGDAIFGQTFRTLNITKSRYQKEHPGTHPFSIVPGEGIRTFCTTETRAAIDSWRSETYLPRARFGVKAIDEKLDVSDNPSPDCGRVICLEGKLGTYKTQLGTCFLQALDEEGDDAVGLVISMRYGLVDILNKIEDPFFKRAFDQMLGDASERPFFCKLPQGNSFPDEIIRSIQEEFNKANRTGKKIRRVLLDNPGEWEDLCPILQKDPIFASTLISFLRKRGARILVTNRMIAPSSSKLIRAILEQVETSIQLDTITLGGQSVNTVQIVRSKYMTHDPQKHRIVQTQDELLLRPLESFSQFDSQGRVITTKIKIITRKQTFLTKSYWKKTSSLLRASIPSRVTFEETSSFGHRFALNLSNESSLDSLNIVEIDEHELQHPDAIESLAELPFVGRTGSFDDPVAESLKTIPEFGRDRVVPFFNNTSCLLFDEHEVEFSNDISWPEIVEEAKKWKERNKAEGETRPFFSFPMSEPENWNCLFLEILAGTSSSADWITKSTKLGDILSYENRIRREILDASEIFHQVVHDEYMRVISSGALKRSNRFDRSEPSAVVSRQWFTTLQETLREMGKLEQRSANSPGIDPVRIASYRVRRLPGNWSVTGHWYLGILRNSISIPAGHKFLEFVTSRAANEDRLRVGVGLPVYGSDFTLQEKSCPSWPCHDSEFFREIPCKYISRSKISDYLENTNALTKLLQSIVRLVKADDESFRQNLEGLWSQFRKLAERKNK